MTFYVILLGGILAFAAILVIYDGIAIRRSEKKKP